jgi:outer membrane biosynthesis protein TonB
VLKVSRIAILFVAVALLMVSATACQGRDRSTATPDTPGSDNLADSNLTEAPATDDPANPDGTTEATLPPPAIITETPPPPEPTPTDTREPTPTDTPPPPPTEMPTETPAPTETPTPPPTETPPPTPTVVAEIRPEWLDRLNLIRSMANLPEVSELDPLNQGSSRHSQYMVVNDKPVAHSEDPNNPLFSPDGNRAAANGNIFATQMIEANYVWSMNFWISAPFHLLALIDPTLHTVGYGDHNEEVGTFQMASVIDLRSATREPNDATYPVFFPGDGSQTWVTRFSLYEWPNPYASCPGYSSPTGPAIILQLGDGSKTPKVTSHIIAKGDQPLESCIFDETSYFNSNAYQQLVGRQILDLQDAIVIIPRNPLPINETYNVRVSTTEGTYNWSFSTIRRPPGEE